MLGGLHPMNLVLAGDIGGTKTNLALFRGPVDQLAMEGLKTYASHSATSPLELIDRFLDEAGRPALAGAALGIAGPVVGGTATATNLPWTVSEEEIATHCALPKVILINDLQATACAVPLLPADKFLPLNDLPFPGRGTIGLIAAGTGLGEALLVRHRGGYIPCASEGGHQDFAPQNEQEFGLRQHLARQYGHVSLERLVSGPGLAAIHRFLCKEARQPEPEWLHDRRGADHGAIIAEAGLDGHEPLCTEALTLFASLYGAAAGNLALVGLTTGGICLGGGIAPKITPILTGGAFMRSFLAKGRLSHLLAQVPVRIIMDSQAALWGAAAHFFHAAEFD